MKTTGREFFYSVSGLMAPKYMVNDSLEESIDQFVEYVPKNTESLEQFANNKLDITAFVDELEKLYIMLCSIHAHWLEQEAARILRLIEVDEGELCKTLVPPFVTNVRTLAIDIQMAQNNRSEVSYRKRSEMERYKDVVSSMKIVITLIKDEDYKKAFDIAKSINELQDSEYIMPLVSYITNKNKEYALVLAEDIHDKFKQKVDSLNKATISKEKKKILLVDDMPEILTVVSRMLNDHYHVYPFKDSKEALRAAEMKHQPDAFILDIDMPKMDGFMLAEKIRQKPRYKTAPILFLTGNSTKDNLIKSTRFDPTAFIVKPVNKDIIISRLNSCFETHTRK